MEAGSSDESAWRASGVLGHRKKVDFSPNSVFTVVSLVSPRQPRLPVPAAQVAGQHSLVFFWNAVTKSEASKNMHLRQCSSWSRQSCSVVTAEAPPSVLLWSKGILPAVGRSDVPFSGVGGPYYDAMWAQQCNTSTYKDEVLGKHPFCLAELQADAEGM
jgi:hypothetical protein